MATKNVKTCNKCLIEKDETKFLAINRGQKIYRSNTCMECKKKLSREKYLLESKTNKKPAYSRKLSPEQLKEMDSLLRDKTTKRMDIANKFGLTYLELVYYCQKMIYPEKYLKIDKTQESNCNKTEHRLHRNDVLLQESFLEESETSRNN